MYGEETDDKMVLAKSRIFDKSAQKILEIELNDSIDMPVMTNRKNHNLPAIKEESPQINDSFQFNTPTDQPKVVLPPVITSK